MSIRIFAGTGHRPNKIGYKGKNGYNPQTYKKLLEYVTEKLKELKPDKVISGMALGFDTALAEASVNLNIPFLAYIPCLSQANPWHIGDKEKYIKLLEKSEKSVIISTKYTYSCMQDRNERMVDDCDVLLAFFNGSPGGTKNCVDYAKKKNKEIINIWRSLDG